MKKLLSSKRGEMYIDQIVTIIVITAFMVFAISTLKVGSVKSTADTIADNLLETAAYYGCFGQEYEERLQDLQQLYPNFPFTVEVNGEWYNAEYKRVQLGDTMTVTVSYEVSFSGFGTTVRIPLTTVRTGASENYWKTDG